MERRQQLERNDACFHAATHWTANAPYPTASGNPWGNHDVSSDWKHCQHNGSDARRCYNRDKVHVD